jgi:DNA-nicking Smr family endonuclease
MAKRDRAHLPLLADWHLWTEVTRSVSPLRRSALAGLRQMTAPPPAEAATTPKWEQPLARTPFLPGYRPEPHPRQMAPGRTIEPKLRRKLMRGRIEIDATLDLHGMRRGEARAALVRFLNARHARGARTILVITGKGLKAHEDDAGRITEHGVLRAMLPIWLSEPELAPIIAGWSPAAQDHGGAGAFYVRLRRSGPGGPRSATSSASCAPSAASRSRRWPRPSGFRAPISPRSSTAGGAGRPSR